jgi:hypothetical protein
VWKTVLRIAKFVRKTNLPFQETATQFQPWDKIDLGIVGPLNTTEGGCKYILTHQDNLSKYVIAIPMLTQTAEKVTLAFLHYIVLLYGIPQFIVTDQGSQFMSDFSRDYVNYSN